MELSALLKMTQKVFWGFPFGFKQYYWKTGSELHLALTEGNSSAPMLGDVSVHSRNTSLPRGNLWSPRMRQPLSSALQPPICRKGAPEQTCRSQNGKHYLTSQVHLEMGMLGDAEPPKREHLNTWEYNRLRDQLTCSKILSQVTLKTMSALVIL